MPNIWNNALCRAVEKNRECKRLEVTAGGADVSEAKKRNVPTWMKVVIGAISLLLGLVVGLAIVVGGFMLKANDPNYKKEIAMGIAEFPDPLPAGFTYGTATDVANINTVLINHSPEQMDISISEIDITDPTVKKALDNNFEMKNDSSTFQKHDSGTLEVANHTLEYKTGSQTLGTAKIAMLEGRITDIPDKFISIQALSNNKGDFNLPLFKTITDSIKSLNPTAHHN
jgi:hypothetical protein